MDASAEGRTIQHHVTSAGLRVGLTLGVALLLALGALVPPGPVAAADTDDTVDRPFRDGIWMGTLAASGIADGQFPDATATMNTAMDGTFTAHVSGGQVVGGTWVLDGGSDGIIATEFGTGDVSNVFGGSGPVGGDAQALELGGGVDTTWQIDIGGYSDTSQDPHRLGPFTVEVLYLDCDTLVGRFEDAFEQQVADAGAWRTTLGGTFQAQHLGDDPAADIVDLAEGVLEAAAALSSEAAAALARDASTIDTGLRDRFRSLVAVGLSTEAQIAELGDAATCLFPAHADHFGQLITVSVQQAAATLLRDGSLDAASLEFLAETLLAVGGAGLGAAPGTLAGELDDLVGARASQILDAAAVSDADERAAAGCGETGVCLPAEPEVVQALRAAELLFVDVTIDGQDWGFAEVHSWLILHQIEQAT